MENPPRGTMGTRVLLSWSSGKDAAWALHVLRDTAGVEVVGLLTALNQPSGTDLCGENGEFHTFAWAGPMFRESVGCSVGEVVERDGFVFAHLVPAPPGPTSKASGKS